MKKFIILVMLVFVLTSLKQSNLLALAQSDSALLFIENVGQFEESVHFQTYSSNRISLSLTEEALWFTILEQPDVETQVGKAVNATASSLPARPPVSPQRGVNLKLSFVGANPQPRLEPFNRLDTRVSYFTGRDPVNWRTEVPVWGGIRYVDLYPGIDLELTSERGQLVQRLVVRNEDAVTATGSSSSTTPDLGPLEDVRLQIDGAEALTLDEAGHMGLSTSVGNVSLPLFQVVAVDGALLELSPTSPELNEFEIAAPFWQSPTPASGSAEVTSVQANSDLIFSTLLGGDSGTDDGWGLAADEAGNVYVTGMVSTGFPTTPGAFDTSFGGVYADAFVAKLNPLGDGLVYATFLGGSDYERAFGLAIDEAGNAYVAGNTMSADFPVTPGVFDDSFNGAGDTFVVKVNASGTELVYATFIGGTGSDQSYDLALDEAGNVYVAGFTGSVDFPTTPDAFDTSYADLNDAFVIKLNANGSDLVYATFLGADASDYGSAIAVDEAGQAYVTGYTYSTDFPTTPGAFDTNGGTTFSDAFVVKLNVEGGGLVYATFLGGNRTEYGWDIAIDQTGHAYLTGLTWSSDFPITPDAFDTSYASPHDSRYEGDAFVAKLAVDGTQLAYATFLGGSGLDIGHSVAVDETGRAYVTGWTYSYDFPTTPDAFDPACQDCAGKAGYTFSDAFVTKMNTGGTGLAYSTFLRGNQGYDMSYASALDGAGHFYITGNTSSQNFPTTEGAFDTTFDGWNEAFVAKFALGDKQGTEEPPPTPTPVPEHSCAPTLLETITVGDMPRGIAVDPARSRTYVANYGSNSVSVIDSASNTVIQNVPDVISANGLAYDPTQNVVWVTNYNINQVTPIDAASLTALSPIAVEDGPWGVAYDPVHNYVYVVNSQADSVTVIDAATRTVVATLNDTFNQPFQVAANPVTGRVYVANFGGHSVTVIEGTSISKTVDLYDSTQPYGLAVDETRELVYVATVDTNRIVVIGPDPQKGPDQFYGWAAFYRGFGGDRSRPVPLRAMAINPDVGPAGDGGHLWTTTVTTDGSQTSQALLIPKGWGGYFHFPLVGEASPDLTSEGNIAIDRDHNRVYVTRGSSPGTVTVLGDHSEVCPLVAPADVQPDGSRQFDVELFSLAALTQGDVTGDGRVDILDLAFISSHYGTNDPAADVNGDGKVDIFDLVTAANNFGRQVR